MSRMIFQMGHGVQPVGPARMAGDENQLVVAAPALLQLQKVLDLGRLVVLIDAEEADVEVVARILEVVGIAAEEGDVLFRREDQPHVGVFLELIEMILAALKQRDHVAAQAGLVERFLLDRVDHRPAGQLRVGRPTARLHRGVHSLGHVLDVHQDVQFQIDALHLFGLRSWRESRS